LYIGLDIGTSGTKAALIRDDGMAVSESRSSYGFSDVREGRRELDPETVWNAVLECIRNLSGREDAKTITVSSLGEAVIPVDREGKALCAGISGTDIRGTEELKELTEKAGEKKLVEITGQNPSVIYSVNKILWLKKNRPDIYERCWKILTFQDFVIFRLSREACIDYSMACRTMLFDAGTNEWSDELLKITGIEKDKLSRPVRAGNIAGNVTNEASALTGLPVSAKVIAGTHDHVCNAIGCGAYSDGKCANTVGTTEGVTAMFKNRMAAADILKYQISCEPSIADHLYNTVAWNNTSGVLLRWFVTEFVRKKEEDLIPLFTAMNKRMKKEPTDLIILPHFSGAATPYMDSTSKGAILGLSLDTSEDDIYKALMEGANYELALILDCCRSAGLDVRTVIATGGALSEQLLQVKADILGMEIHTVLNGQTGTLGGAVLGSVASGAYSCVQDAVHAMVRPGRTYEPDDRRHAFYEGQLRIYRDVYPALKGINGRMKNYAG